MRGIDHQHIDPCANKCIYPLIRIRAGSNRCTHTKLTEAVFTGMRERLRFVKILYGNEPFQTKVIVDHKDFFNPVLMQQSLHFLKWGALLDRHQFFLWRHNRGYRLFRIRFKANVSSRHNARQIALIHHGHARNTIGASQLNQLSNTCGALDCDGVFHHSALELLDPANLFGLLNDGHILMDDAHTPLLRQSNCKSRLGHGIHRGRHQRNI